MGSVRTPSGPLRRIPRHRRDQPHGFRCRLQRPRPRRTISRCFLPALSPTAKFGRRRGPVLPRARLSSEISEGDLVACGVHGGHAPVHVGRAWGQRNEEPPVWKPGARGEGPGPHQDGRVPRGAQPYRDCCCWRWPVVEVWAARAGPYYPESRSGARAKSDTSGVLAARWVLQVQACLTLLSAQRCW